MFRILLVAILGFFNLQSVCFALSAQERLEEAYGSKGFFLLDKWFYLGTWEYTSSDQDSKWSKVLAEFKHNEKGELFVIRRKIARKSTELVEKILTPSETENWLSSEIKISSKDAFIRKKNGQKFIRITAQVPRQFKNEQELKAYDQAIDKIVEQIRKRNQS